MDTSRVDGVRAPEHRGNTRNLRHAQVQPHMKKCFDGIAHLDFDPDLNILAALDAPPPKGERLEFTYDQCDHRMINPKDSGALAAFYEGAFTSMRLVSRRGDGG